MGGKVASGKGAAGSAWNNSIQSIMTTAPNVKDKIETHVDERADTASRSVCGADGEMLTIQLITPAYTKTITVEEIPNDDVITYRPCFYCGKELVRAPRKYCSNSHKVLACVYNVNRKG